MAADDAYSTNLFLVLGKYAARQDENLLTQAVVLLFNRVGRFRDAFCDLLIERSAGSRQAHDAMEMIAHSQVRRRSHGRNVIVDMEIRDKNRDTPLYLVESKLDSGLGAGQLRGYGTALAKLGKARLVVITRYGFDEALWNRAPRGTIWLSWPIVAEVAGMAAKRASRLDQLLIKDFLDMTRMRGIAAVSPMTADAWQRLGKFSGFTLDAPGIRALGPRTLDAVALALQRLQEHRDSAWEGLLTRKAGWRPYQSLYKDKDRDSGCVVLQAGFWRKPPKAHVVETYLGLELQCTTKPQLSVVTFWHLGQGHPRYDPEDPYEEYHYYDYEETAAATRKLFRMDMSEAVADIRKRLRQIAQGYLRWQSTRT